MSLCLWIISIIYEPAQLLLSFCKSRNFWTKLWGSKLLYPLHPEYWAIGWNFTFFTKGSAREMLSVAGKRILKFWSKTRPLSLVLVCQLIWHFVGWGWDGASLATSPLFKDPLVSCPWECMLEKQKDLWCLNWQRWNRSADFLYDFCVHHDIWLTL